MFIDDITIESRYKASHESTSLLREAIRVEYSSIPSDDKHLKTPGFCVPDQIDAIYGKLNKKLSRDNFIKQCYEIETKNCNIDNALNFGLDDDKQWEIEYGVRTSTLNQILKKHDISYYTFDVCNNCFDKYFKKPELALIGVLLS